MPPAPPEIVPFDTLRRADLVLEREYAGGTQGHSGDDPLGRLVPVGNQGGFRYKGSVSAGTVRLVVLYTTGVDPDWPDVLDPQTGDFTYYGDNRHPGKRLHETPRGGNELLRQMFQLAHGSPEDRRRVPPVLLFEKTGHGRSVRFRGLLAPGSSRLAESEELVAVWRTQSAHRFQNYRSHFTVLNVPEVSREWLDEVVAGDPLGAHCPAPWRRWVQGRFYDALAAPRTIRVRPQAEQYPRETAMPRLEAVYRHFSERPVDFEYFAADLWQQSDPHVLPVEVTRASRDGGRDAIGQYSVGPGQDPIKITFALEAKCYRPGAGIGVKLVARLISRIRHRDFGVFVTTSHINPQAYQEVREDEHPIIFITGGDIVQLLSDQGYRTLDQVNAFLTARYPAPEATEEPPVTVPSEVELDETASGRTVDGRSGEIIVPAVDLHRGERADVEGIDRGQASGAPR